MFNVCRIVVFLLFVFWFPVYVRCVFVLPLLLLRAKAMDAKCIGLHHRKRVKGLVCCLLLLGDRASGTHLLALAETPTYKIGGGVLVPHGALR